MKLRSSMLVPSLSPILFALSFSAFAMTNVANEPAANMTNEARVSTLSEASAPLSFEQITQRYLNNPQVLGEARLKFLFLKIYDAKLSASDGEWSKDTPFALSLTYLRDFDGEEIASRSVDEMRDIGYTDEVVLAKWFEQMRQAFPNVKEGENITGVVDKKQHTHFYHQGKLVASIDDTLFAQSFFGIWLNEKTSEPKMRKQLLGIK